MLEDKAAIAQSVKDKYPVDTPSPKIIANDALVAQAWTFLANCTDVIDGCNSDSLPKLAVEATLYYSRIAQVIGSSRLVEDTDRAKVDEHRTHAKQLLEQAAKLCELHFKGADTLAQAVEQSLRLLGKEFYAEVTKEEVEAIKRAMVSGPGGIATHSGHWYKCINGHPVSLGILSTRFGISIADQFSSLTASVACRCNKLVAPSAVSQLEDGTIKLSMAYHALSRWSRSFSLEISGEGKSRGITNRDAITRDAIQMGMQM